MIMPIKRKKQKRCRSQVGRAPRRKGVENHQTMQRVGQIA